MAVPFQHDGKELFSEQRRRPTISDSLSRNGPFCFSADFLVPMDDVAGSGVSPDQSLVSRRSPDSRTLADFSVPTELADLSSGQ
jgi:hypothetical protein